MSLETTVGKSASALSFSGLLQRKCDCGQHTSGGKCSACSQRAHDTLQRSAVGGHEGERSDNTVPPIVHEVLQSPGQRLDTQTRSLSETRFGHDFSRVRIHSDARAAASAPPIIQRAPAGGTLSSGITIGDIDIKSNDPNCEYQKGEVARSDAPQGILENDIEKGEFLGIAPPEAVVIADFKVGEGQLRPSTASDLKKFWLPTFNKSAAGSLEIAGFTDCTGWEKHNQVLREQRAQAVARFLPGMWIKSVPLGEYPVPNTSERGRALNRSVIITNKKPPPHPEPQHEVNIKLEEPDTLNCSQDQRRQLAIAFPVAKLMAQRAQAALSNPDKGPVTEFLLHRHFGAEAMSHLPEIRAGFSKILSNWKDWDSRFDCESQTEGGCPHENGIVLAYVNTKGGSSYGTVHVCAEAFNKPSDMQRLSAALLHELSHRLDNTSDKMYCGFEGQGQCSSLDTTTAIDNADSFAQFAREIFNASL